MFGAPIVSLGTAESSNFVHSLNQFVSLEWVKLGTSKFRTQIDTDEC